MTAPFSLRKGRCPGALAPMRTGDGLLVRLRVSGKSLDLDCMEAIADGAARFGNGSIEISSRANLQLRGVGEAGLPLLQQRLRELGLLDAGAAAEAVRNVVASPLADIDPQAIIDTAPVVAALAARLGEDNRLHRLPAKFGFLIDGGGALPLGDIEADIRFEAFLGPEGPRFAVALAGDGDCISVCAPRDVPHVAAALGLAFLQGWGSDAPRRMRDLTALCGAALVFGAAGLSSSPAPSQLRRRAASSDFLGIQAFGDFFGVGAAPPLGRMTADDLGFLAREARRCSAADVRVAPWRALIVTGLERSGAGQLAAVLARRFIVDPRDPRLALVACSGAPACVNAARAVQAEALEFASSLPPGDGVALHVSGCEKGCAHARAAPLTLVSRGSGYDLVVNGKAGDKPSRTALSKHEIPSLLARLARKPS